MVVFYKLERIGYCVLILVLGRGCFVGRLVGWGSW